MTRNITDGPNSHLVPEHIKATAPLEGATLEEASRLAVTGAERIIFPEQHLDASGKVVSRYLSVWTKNASDPTRYDGTRIDLGKNVRVEDVRTGTSFVAFGLNENVVYHEHRKQKHAFVLEAKADSGRPFEIVEKAIVATIHRSHQEVYSHDYRRDTSHKEESRRWVRSQPQVQGEVLIDVPRAVVRDTADTVRGIAIFLRDKEQRKETNARSIVRKEERRAERLTLKKIRERPVRMVEVIERRHAEMRKKVALLGVIAETGVAVHAAPVFLVALAEKLPAPVRAVEKSLRRHKKRELRIKNYELRKAKREAKKDRVNAQLPKTERIETLRATKEKKRKNKRAKEYIKTADERSQRKDWRGRRKELRPMRKSSRLKSKETLHKPELRPRKERRRRMAGREKKMTAEPIRLKPKEKKRMQKILMRVIRSGGARSRSAREMRVPGERPLMKRKEKKRQLETQLRNTSRKEMVSASRFVFAWVVFLLLRTSNRKPQNESRLSLKRQEGIVKKETRAWILLSIIWYLAMIRESGRGSKQHQPLLPVQAVIFAASS